MRLLNVDQEPASGGEKKADPDGSGSETLSAIPTEIYYSATIKQGMLQV